jgi:hypothetical protein
MVGIIKLLMKMKMKKALMILIGCVFLFGTTAVFAQRSETAKDATTNRLGGVYTPSGSTIVSGSVATLDPVYEVIGSYTSANNQFAAAATVKVNMHFIDGSNRMYRIIQIVNAGLGTTGNLRIRVRPVGTTTALVVAPSNTIGFIFEPTPNMLLPQWVANMPPALQGSLLSHMANMIDQQLGTVVAPTLKVQTSAYTVDPLDDTILFNLSAAATVTLPAANTVSGKTYKIGKVDDSSNILTFSPAIRFSPTVDITTLNYPRTFLVQSDGTNWWVVNQN